MTVNKPLRLIYNPHITDAAVNLALEEYCCRNFDTAHDYLIVYINEASVVIGAHQNPWEEINHQALLNNEIAVYRRISGGGAVYHDRGNVNLAFVTDHHPKKFGNFDYFTQPIIKGLDRFGVGARHAHHNTIEVNGKKISGNAQFTTTKRMLSHGTLLYNSDLALLRYSLDSDFKPVSSKSVASVRREVGNISDFLKAPMAQESFLEKLLDGILAQFPMAEPYALSEAEWDKIYQLADEKYRSWEWTFGHTPPFSFMEHYPEGDLTLPLRVWVKKGYIDRLESEESIVLKEVVPTLSDQLIGQRYHPSYLQQILNR